MNHAEAQATLNDVCAIQIKCTNDPDKPVDLQLWGGDEFTVFTDPEDPRQPFAVVTIDRYNERTRYKLWFEDEVRTFLTDQYSSDRTAGAGVAIREQDGRGEYLRLHPLRVPALPRSGPPVLDAGPGDVPRKAELRINDRLSELDELIMKYGRPIGVFKNVTPTFTPEIGPGRFMRLLPRRHRLHRRRLRRRRRAVGRVPSGRACHRVDLGRPREVHEAGGDGGQLCPTRRSSSNTADAPSRASA